MSTSIHASDYMIREGETIHTLSKKFNTTPADLIKINGNVPLLIQPHRQIKVPVSSDLYVTQNTDSVNDLIIRFKLTPEELIRLNPELILTSGIAICIQDKKE